MNKKNGSDNAPSAKPDYKWDGSFRRWKQIQNKLLLIWILPRGLANAAETPEAAPAATKSLLSSSILIGSKICKR